MAPKNTSFVLQSPYKVQFEDRPSPELESPHDVIVQVKYTGICGSDVHYWQHGELGPFKLKDPMVLGHESAGTVTQVGSAVTTLQAGDNVALEPGIFCGLCTQCTRGAYNLCPEMRFAATPPVDGTLTRYWRSPAVLAYKLPESMTLKEGALMEPLAVAVHIVRQAAVVPGESVVVWGAGPVGLLCCAVAKAFGATTIVCADVNQDRLDFAAKYAATQVFSPKSDEGPEAQASRLSDEAKLTEHGGADVVIDASGAPPCIQASFHVIRAGGRFVQGGIGKPDIEFPIGALGSKEVTAMGSFRYKGGDYALAIELVSSGKVNVKELITGTVKFEDAEEAFRNVKDGKGIKTLIAGPGEEAK